MKQKKTNAVRLLEQQSAKGHPATLAARQASRAHRQDALPELDRVQQLRGPLAGGSPGGHAEQRQRPAEDLLDGASRIQ